jgi:hypothetical protein
MKRGMLLMMMVLAVGMLVLRLLQLAVVRMLLLHHGNGVG